MCWRPPHEEGIRGHRLAGNIQRLLRYESRMDSYAKAASGSYYLEQLTGQGGRSRLEKFSVFGKMPAVAWNNCDQDGFSLPYKLTDCNY